MAEYSKNSIINIAKDKITVQKGNVVQSNGKIILGINSICSFSYNYDTKNKSLLTNGFLVKYNVENSENEVSSRFNPKLSINIIVQYFEETKDANDNTIDYVDGGFSVYPVYPYYNDEIDGYLDMYVTDTRHVKMKSVKIELQNNSDNEITILELNVNKELDTESVVQENLDIDIILEEVIKYKDGLTVRFTGADDLDLWWLGMNDNNPTEIDVNHSKTIILTDKKSESKPL